MLWMTVVLVRSRCEGCHDEGKYRARSKNRGCRRSEGVRLRRRRRKRDGKGRKEGTVERQMNGEAYHSEIAGVQVASFRQPSSNARILRCHVWICYRNSSYQKLFLISSIVVIYQVIDFKTRHCITCLPRMLVR